MRLDHLFICSNHQGKDADALVNFGLSEGSNRVHPGQGTRNRKFYFNNFFLEIIWESDKDELKSERIAPTGLWERVHYSETNYSPFGLCLANTDDVASLFSDSITYQPAYTPPGTVFTILPHSTQPYLPWTCRLPKTEYKYQNHEPLDHATGIRQLTKVTLGVPFKNYQNSFTDFIEEHFTIAFTPTEQHHITLEFDHQQQGKSHTFKELPLTIVY
uniref:VOC family protein n=1 Tax=Roseihalotalea indica TaxID=2867963 RepID=A0AA49JFC6_9BACT|nr:VOC family protein [Tunicatimonas sp. TK19036]